MFRTTRVRHHWKSISTSRTRTTPCYCVIILVFYVRDTNLPLHKCFSYMGISTCMSFWRGRWEVLLSGTITRSRKFGQSFKSYQVNLGFHGFPLMPWALVTKLVNKVFEHYLNDPSSGLT
uniref:Uncharacterized protein n=1 Tax=Glossina pallidipes TaxID=7398 RepID=A0A1A9ZLZ2_GLOPL